MMSFMSRKWLSVATVFLVIPCLSLTAVSQEKAQNAPQSVSTDTGGRPNLISAGDLLDISVYDIPEMLQEVRVEDDGQVQLALLGSTKVSGMTAKEAGVVIAHELDSRGLFVRPQVTVLIKEYPSEGVSVTGEVQHPGFYPIMTTRSVLDVISLAGGFTPIADSRVTIKHRGGKEDRVTVKLKGDNAQAAMDEDVQVYPGDLIVVPRAGVVYVLGDVARPGGIVMQDNGSITMVEALAQAGGANPTAAMNGAIVLHKTDTGYNREKIKLNDLVRGKTADLALSANDILFVPGSKIKYLAQNTQSVASSVVGAAVYHAMP
jgi:polysaccharide export outer membrane protein